jgi:excisionase family DNA binding protein
MSHHDPVANDEAAKKQLPIQSPSIRPSGSHPKPLPSTQLQPPTHYEPSGFVPERSFMIGAVSEGRGGAKDALATPPGSRLWHGFAVRRPPVGRGGRGLTFGLIGGGESARVGHPMQMPPSLDMGGMERKPAPVAFFTERTLASFLAVSDRTIRNWIRRGELPSYKLGAARRIDPGDVEDFLARHRDEAA